MQIFVTGGAGFIGSHLVDALIKRGDNVTVYDNLSSGNKEFIIQHIKKKQCRFIHADLLNFKKLKKEIKNHDVVFHIAANPYVRIGEEKPYIDIQQGVIATYNVLESMRQNNINKIVFSSSSTVYGETGPSPKTENYGPLLPISLYGAGKLGAEALISAYCGTFDFQTWIFRFANIVGIRGTHGVIIDFIEKLKRNPKELEILGDGKQCKPYLYVTDCVEGMLYGFDHAQEQINLFNLSCDTMTTVTKIAEMVVEEMGLKNVKFKYTGGKRGWKGDVPCFQLDIRKIEKYGWKPKYTSDEAVRKAIRDILEKPS